MSRATWSKADAEWLATHPVGLPPESFPYLHAHQRWAPLRRQSDRARIDPWNESAFRASFPCSQLDRHERALAWLAMEFGQWRRSASQS